MCKRPLEMVVFHDSQERDAKLPRSSADDGALVPPAGVEPMHAVPLRAIAPQLQRAPRPEEPPYLRMQVLVPLQLRVDLPVHYIGQKLVRDTDLNPQQNRFRIPTDGVQRGLREMLTPEELQAANLLRDPVRRPRPKPEPVRTAGTALPSALTLGITEQGKTIKKKKTGKVHGGLPVKLVDLTAGASKWLLLSRWESSGGTIVKGEGYMNFIHRCSFKEMDVVDIWAFKERASPSFRLFGSEALMESPLYLFLVKATKQDQTAATDPQPQ